MLEQIMLYSNLLCLISGNNEFINTYIQPNVLLSVLKKLQK